MRWYISKYHTEDITTPPDKYAAGYYSEKERLCSQLEDGTNVPYLGHVLYPIKKSISANVSIFIDHILENSYNFSTTFMSSHFPLQTYNGSEKLVVSMDIGTSHSKETLIAIENPTNVI